MKLSYLLTPLLALALGACGNDIPSQTGPQIPCNDQQYYDQVNDTCVPRYRDFDTSKPVSDADAGDGGSDADAATTPDADAAPPDLGPDMTDPNCDVDGDGALAIRCGGNDCDDARRNRAPGYPEICDDVDNDCNDQVNDGIECWFYAHSGQDLYEVDPFKKTLTKVGTQLPNLQDIDTHPDGTLYGVTFDGLYEFDEAGGQWNLVGDFGIDVGDPNGMAIDSTGTAFVTSQDNVYTVDLTTGAATLLGNMQGDFYSSGDCVVNKRDTLFMTSKHDMTPDDLVILSRQTGEATLVGSTGFEKIFGLTAAWGRLYGLTDAGEVLDIDTVDGQATLVHQFAGTRFFGAASTPSR